MLCGFVAEEGCGGGVRWGRLSEIHGTTILLSLSRIESPGFEELAGVERN
jgi:hypothetical protein